MVSTSIPVSSPLKRFTSSVHIIYYEYDDVDNMQPTNEPRGLRIIGTNIEKYQIIIIIST